MSRIPAPLARRIDRLARRAHRFHRFAHHPLCAAYEGEVFRWGRYRICRGCGMAMGGALVGVATGFAVSVLDLTFLIGMALGLFALGLAVVRASGFRRMGKRVTRLLPSGIAAFVVIQSLRPRHGAGILLAAGVGAGLWVVSQIYRRRGPWRTPCQTCPERDASPCSGFRDHFRRERAFQRLTGRYFVGNALGEGAGADKMKST